MIWITPYNATAAAVVRMSVRYLWHCYFAKSLPASKNKLPFVQSHCFQQSRIGFGVRASSQKATANYQ